MKDDTRLVAFLPVTIRQAASALCVLGYVVALVGYGFRRRRYGRSALWEAAALFYLVTFLFVTRAHERHVYPYFALIAAAMIWRRAAIVPYAFVSALYCVNLVLSWRYILPGNRHPQLCPLVWGAGLCMLMLAALPLTLASLTRWAQRVVVLLRYDHRPDSPRLPDDPIKRRKARWILAAILLFALGTRVARLNSPDTRYFDEVYHAYTAEQWVKGNADAWLWRTKAADEGCAYEWTHPPLAKLMMAASMKVFGVHPWAWRLPAALLGTAMVLLVYALARALFHREAVALLAAAFAALDMLPLFASRIGMNDIYFVAFMLAAVLAATKNRYVLAPLAAGCALACKWTMLYGFPLLALIHLLRIGTARQSRPDGPAQSRPLNLDARLNRYALVVVLYTLCVPLIYLGSYWPMVRAGHSWQDVGEVQKQMWYYHTGLKATHPFSSPAWQWPTLRKAVWCFTQKKDVWPEQFPEFPSPQRPQAPKRSTAQSPERSTKQSPERRAGASPASPAASASDTAFAPPAEAELFIEPQVWAANVYAWANPVIWICGEGAILFALIHLLIRRNTAVFIVVAGFLAFWAPWLASPRIMFLYHYLPSLPFLYLALAWAIVHTAIGRRTLIALFTLAALAFVVLYPYVTAVWLPLAWTPVGFHQ